MCVAFWSLEHPAYALILCSNRDEYLSRPTANAHFHTFEPIGRAEDLDGKVLSGRDLLAGGTWAGLNRSGRVAILTNITEPPRKYASSRGELASSFLLPKTPTAPLRDEVDKLVAENGRFAGFNLLLLAPRLEHPEGWRKLHFDSAFVTNTGGGGRITARGLTDAEMRCGGLSNGIDCAGASDWPKVKKGTQALQDVLETAAEGISDAELSERLFQLLTDFTESWTSDPAPADRAALRNTIQVDPILVQVTQSPDHKQYYGTRLSTVLLVRRDGSVCFVERDVWMLDTNGDVVKADAKSQRIFQFQIDLNSISSAERTH
ncbi:NRDE protein-domain-containing protein [Fomitopsis serialis]|uniref:NRDE protein-domain-containing protein n=1 Tax=Fomitopsis serialis TaxID=139415 RepID=UPI002007C526|nr:NRDE protein-domain-containing protein [Neoantrodia serialis]KAH9936490.1 NRDE protein-domain-containing protein [Neoantrodia serialis]